jgi:hypothetical protein
MTDPQCSRPPEWVGAPVDPGVPDCRTGPIGQLRFVAREIAALWRHRRTTGEE